MGKEEPKIQKKSHHKSSNLELSHLKKEDKDDFTYSIAENDYLYQQYKDYFA